jgi:steroid delta-isomerase-like uncharacterized protein
MMAFDVKENIMLAENKALMLRWFDQVWCQGRADVIDELLAPNCVIRGLGADQVGPEQFKPFFAAYRSAFPDVKITVDQAIAEDDMVAVRWSGTGTHKGDGLGFAATGRTARFSGMTMVRIVDGKLVEGWNNFNQFEMLQQLDKIPPLT